MELEISVEDLQKMRELQASVSRDEFCLLDVRQPWESEVAAIGGSRLIPMNEIPSHVQELNRDAHIVAYCHHGQRSLNVVLWLREQGFLRAQSLAGGIDAWSQTIDPAVPRY